MSSRRIPTNVIIIWIIFLTGILSNVPIQTAYGQNGVLKVGLDKDFAPFEWGHDGEVNGFDVDLMNYMAEDLNRSVEYYPLIWDEVLESVKNGTIDVLFATDTPERRVFFDFSLPILYSRWSIYVKENVFGITNILDLANHTVAVCNLYASHEYINKTVPGAHLVLVNNVEIGIEMLYNGEVFAFFTDYYQANYYILQMVYTGLKVIGDPVIMGPFCLGVKKGNHELLSQLNVSLTNVKNSGNYDSIYEKWFGTEIEVDLPYPEIIKFFFPIILVLICGSGFLLLWNYSLKKSVHKKTQELSNTKDLLEERLIELKNNEQEIKESEEKYKKAFNRAEFYKDVFAHDINNVLQSILTGMQVSQLILDNPEKIENLKINAQVIKEQVIRGSKLVFNMRKLSQLEETKMKLKKIEILKILKNVISFVKKSYKDKNISIRVNSVGDKLFIKANKFLEDIFENILINAVRHNRNLIIEITVRISREQKKGINYLKIEFLDNGIGVDDTHKEKIFKRGYSEEKSVHGMGIGLSLVSGIIESYNGKIWVEDRVEGDRSNGSNFVLLIPEVD